MGNLRKIGRWLEDVNQNVGLERVGMNFGVDEKGKVALVLGKGVEGVGECLVKFKQIFVAAITFPPFLLCRYFCYQLVAYCVCFQMICEMSL